VKKKKMVTLKMMKKQLLVEHVSSMIQGAALQRGLTPGCLLAAQVACKHRSFFDRVRLSVSSVDDSSRQSDWLACQFFALLEEERKRKKERRRRNKFKYKLVLRKYLNNCIAFASVEQIISLILKIKIHFQINMCDLNLPSQPSSVLPPHVLRATADQNSKLA